MGNDGGNMMQRDDREDKRVGRVYHLWDERVAFQGSSVEGL
jgi:hypothetical protein